jgi:hypothetical protein
VASKKRRRPVEATRPAAHEDLITITGPGQFLVRVPRDRDPSVDLLLRRTPYDVARETAIRALTHGDVVWPEHVAPRRPQTAEQRRDARTATLRRIATGPREFAALLDNEGLPQVPWQSPSEDELVRLTRQRRDAEIRGLQRSRPFQR